MTPCELVSVVAAPSSAVGAGGLSTPAGPADETRAPPPESAATGAGVFGVAPGVDAWLGSAVELAPGVDAGAEVAAVVAVEEPESGESLDALATGIDAASIAVGVVGLDSTGAVGDAGLETVAAASAGEPAGGGAVKLAVGAVVSSPDVGAAGATAIGLGKADGASGDGTAGGVIACAGVSEIEAGEIAAGRFGVARHDTPVDGPCGVAAMGAGELVATIDGADAVTVLTAA